MQTTTDSTKTVQANSVGSGDLLGAWGITDDAGYLRYGGHGLDRARDEMWEMLNQDPRFRGKKLRLIWCESMEEFDKPFPWYPPNV